MASRRHLGFLAWALLVAPIGACSADGDEAGLSACAVLGGEAPSAEYEELSVPEGGRATTTVERALGWGFLALDEGSLLIYLEPGLDDELEPMAAEVSDRPGVASTRIVDREETFRTFQALFADQETILRNVDPEDLPTSVQVDTESARHGRDLAAWASEDDRVFDVTTFDEAAPHQFQTTMVAESDRRRWRTIADRLDRIEGSPAWASDSASVLRALLDDGVTGVTGDDDLMERLTDASNGMAEAASGCDPTPG